MNPFSRLSLTLLIALIVWAPAGYRVLQNRLDILLGAMFFALAIVLAYAGTGVLASLLQTYSQQQRAALEKARRVQREIEYMERSRRATDNTGNTAGNPMDSAS